MLPTDSTPKTVITKKEAKKQGLKKYFTGRPCKNAHTAERYVCDDSCVMCAKIRTPEKVARIKRHAERNKDKIAAYQKQYRSVHREEARAYEKEYATRKRPLTEEERLERNKKSRDRRASNLELAMANEAKRRARDRAKWLAANPPPIDTETPREKAERKRLHKKQVKAAYFQKNKAKLAAQKREWKRRKKASLPPKPPPNPVILAEKKKVAKERADARQKEYNSRPKVKAQRKERQLGWQRENRDHLKQYRKANREKLLAQDKARREKRDPRIVKAQRQAEYLRNKHKIRGRAKKHYEATKHLGSFAAANRNRKARIRNAEGHHTAADERALWEKQNHKCAVPGCCEAINDIRGSKDHYHVDHIKALINGGTNWPWNLQILCAFHNNSKHDDDEYEWAQRELGLLFVK